MKFFFLFIALIFHFCYPLFSQENQKSDSAYNAIINQTNHLEGLEKLYFLEDKLYILSVQDINLYKKVASHLIGVSYTLKDSIKKVESIRAKNLANLANNLNKMNEFGLALDSAQKSYELMKKNANFIEIGFPLAVKAEALHNLGRNTEATNTFQEAIGYYPDAKIDSFLEKYYTSEKEIPDSVRLTIIIYSIFSNGYGLFLQDIKLYKEALVQFERNLEIQRKTGDKLRENAALANLGYTLMFLEDYDSAIKYLNLAKDLAIEMDNLLFLSNIYGMLSACYRNIEKYKISLEFMQKCIKLSNQIGSVEYLAESYYELGETFFKLNRIDSAKIYYHKAVWLATFNQQLNFKANAYEKLANYYKSMGKMDSALFYTEAFIKLKDSLELNKANENIKRFEQSLKLQEKENDILKLKQEKAKSDAEKTIFIAALAVILAAIIFLYINLRNRKKLFALLEIKNKELQEVNDTKDKFFSIIAHDLRNPLSTMVSVTEVLSNSEYDLPEEEKSMFLNEMNYAANNLLNLLQNLLTWARSQRNAIAFEPVISNVKELVLESLEPIEQTAKQKNIQSEIFIEDDLFVLCDKDLSKTIIRNLFSNAIKFTNSNEIIRISAISDKDFIKISIEDNGIGMSQETLSRLFRIDSNQSTLGTNQERGTGLGLILCKEFVEKQGGEIWVESQLGIGSCFYFTLPKSK